MGGDLNETNNTLERNHVETNACLGKLLSESQTLLDQQRKRIHSLCRIKLTNASKSLSLIRTKIKKIINSQGYKKNLEETLNSKIDTLPNKCSLK